MKHGKRLTVKQKIFLKEHRLNPDNWFICKNTPEEIVIEHRHTQAVKVIKKD